MVANIMLYRIYRDDSSIGIQHHVDNLLFVGVVHVRSGEPAAARELS